MQQLPAYLRQSAAPDLVAIAQQALGGITPPSLSIKNGKFTLVDQAGNEMPLPTFDPQLGVYADVCIVDTNKHKSRIFYKNDYDPSAQAYMPPECWSDNGTGPSSACSEPQASTCADCQWSKWGSAVSAQGKGIPACGEYMKLALMLPGLGPQVENMFFLLRVPPASLTNYRAYSASFAGQGVNLCDIITRVYFDRAKVGVLLFQVAPAPQGQPLPYIGEGTYRLREAAYAEKKTAVLVGHLDVARNPALPVAQPVAQIAAPQVQQPVPFGAPAAAPQSTAMGLPSTNPSVAATAPSPSETPAPARRRRRTQAEIAAANAATQSQPAPVAPPQPAGFGQPAAPMAPFPINGPNPAPAAAPPSNFGIVEPAPANPEMVKMLAGLGLKPPGSA